MIEPINDHVLIKPLEHKTFLPTEKGQYDEVGIVVSMGHNDYGFLLNLFYYFFRNQYSCVLSVDDKVWFDGWLASKYPTGEGDEVFWLVPFKDIKAVEKQNGENKIPEQSL